MDYFNEFFRFIGVKKVGGVREVQETMNEVCYDEVLSYVKKGHQVLVSSAGFLMLVPNSILFTSEDAHIFRCSSMLETQP